MRLDFFFFFFLWCSFLASTKYSAVCQGSFIYTKWHRSGGTTLSSMQSVCFQVPPKILRCKSEGGRKERVEEEKEERKLREVGEEGSKEGYGTGEGQREVDGRRKEDAMTDEGRNRGR